jgi:hypothetical protein
LKERKILSASRRAAEAVRGSAWQGTRHDVIGAALAALARHRRSSYLE